MNMNKTAQNITYAVIFLLAWVTAGYAYADGSKAAVIVNGVKISESALNNAVAGKMRSTMFHRDLPDEKMKKIRDKVIEEIVNNELIYQDSAGKVDITADAINSEYEKMKSRFGDEKKFKEALQKASVTEEQVKKDIERTLAIKQMKDLSIYQKASVSDEEVRAYFDKNRNRYKEPEKLRIREIFFSVPSTATKEEREAVHAKAEKALQRNRNGEDFGLLAWELSEDKYKYKSGDVGYVHKGMLTPETEEAIWKLKKGETSDVVRTIYGYYLFFLEEKVPARDRSYGDAAEEIKTELRKKKIEELEKSYISSLREKAEIKIVGQE